MTPQELRIGNIFYRKHGKGWTETVITENIMSDIFGISLTYALNDFEPIPLTPEVLERCGFKIRSYQNGVRYIIVNDGLWLLIAGTDIIHLCLASALSMDDLRTRAMSLHQLQNLFFALTGTELTHKP